MKVRVTPPVSLAAVSNKWVGRSGLPIHAEMTSDGYMVARTQRLRGSDFDLKRREVIPAQYKSQGLMRLLREVHLLPSILPLY